MVKETRFRHQPVRIENGLYVGSQQLDILGYRADLKSAVIDDDTGVDDTIWTELTLSEKATVPDEAIAVILDVEVSDDASSGGTACYMAFCPTGSFIAETPEESGKVSYVYCANVNARKFSRVIIVELSTNESIHYRINASGAAFNYNIRLLGWLIGGTRVSKIAPIIEDLLCKLFVRQ